MSGFAIQKVEMPTEAAESMSQSQLSPTIRVSNISLRFSSGNVCNSSGDMSSPGNLL
ncbi:MAG: hypothetical protein V3S14_12995 [Anaerolineae bacterium]